MASPTLNFITFNQDHSCLAVGKSIYSSFLLPSARRLAFAHRPRSRNDDKPAC